MFYCWSADWRITRQSTRGPIKGAFVDPVDDVVGDARDAHLRQDETGAVRSDFVDELLEFVLRHRQNSEVEGVKDRLDFVLRGVRLLDRRQLLDDRPLAMLNMAEKFSCDQSVVSVCRDAVIREEMVLRLFKTTGLFKVREMFNNFRCFGSLQSWFKEFVRVILIKTLGMNVYFRCIQFISH